MRIVNPRSQLVLSLFPGVGLLDRPFIDLGFVIVRGPDLIHGGDVTELHGIAGKFDGIIGGPSCQGFSAANRHRMNPDHPSVVNSIRMLAEYARLCDEFRPVWFLCENVPSVPDVIVPGYKVQRLMLSDYECGGVQVRNRCFQFGHLEGFVIRPKRVNDQSKTRRIGWRPKSVTGKAISKHQTYADQCRRQGLEKPIPLPGWTKEAKFQAIGNGVPLSVGRAVAAAVVDCSEPLASDCPCGCGRTLTGRQKSGSVGCRKRLQFMRQNQRSAVDPDGFRA